MPLLPPIRFGPGEVTLDAVTGAPVRFADRERPGRRYLLDVSGRHDVEHQWGSGHIVTDRGSGRWLASATVFRDGSGIHATHEPVPGVRVMVSRGADGTVWRERYTVGNVGHAAVTITGLGVQTPFADRYGTAQDALRGAVHAHVFTGGAWAWVLAQPMSGVGRCLGLVVTDGALWAYAVESRTRAAAAGARGHLVLLVTDHARNSGAFGGQPVVRLAPGQSTVLAWELAWYDSPAAFLAATRPPAALSAYAAEVGTPIEVHAAGVPVSCAAEGVTVEPTADGHRVAAARHGSYHLDIGGGRTEVLFHLPLAELVRRRVAYLLARHRATHRPGLLGNAFVPVDTRTGLTICAGDRADGSERIGMAQLLQQAVRLGLAADPAAVELALDGWAAFARQYLIDDDAPRRGARQPRWSEVPWLAGFFQQRYAAHRRPADLELAAELLERGHASGIGDFLAIGLPRVTIAVAADVSAAGDPARALALRERLVAAARQCVRLGARLPGTEVAYGQSVVAPVLDLLIEAHALTGDRDLRDAIAGRLPWLLAFGGPQPHVRLHGIAVRQGDGHRSGGAELRGDVFPHHWSALTATVLRRLPPDLATPETDRLAQAILAANLVNYRADGSATRAFVMPSAVDGRPAHRADPLDDDQDWHLVQWLSTLPDVSADPPAPEGRPLSRRRSAPRRRTSGPRAPGPPAR